MLKIALFEPEIPPNTGNIIRLCANTGAELHLIEPLGFSMSHKRLRRAGLDYDEYATVKLHEDYDAFEGETTGRIIGFSTKGTIRHTDVDYQAGDILMFGPETRGLPDDLIATLAADARLARIPMVAASRSLNLANAVSVVLYEAWRQLGFADGQ